jgi:hypothetical protein
LGERECCLFCHFYSRECGHAIDALVAKDA